MKLFLILLATLLPALASADVKKDGKYDLYSIQDDNAPVIHIKFSTDVHTRDNCNHFGLSGHLRTVDTGDSKTLIQEFVADFDVVHTELGCPDGPERVIHLESEAFAIMRVAGTIWARVLVPENFQLKMETHTRR